MKKLSKNIDKIGFYLLSIIIIIFSLIIGANDKMLRVLPISILLLLIIIFLVCKKIIKKDESIFFKNKIDITVFIFTLSTILPLLFKTYASLSYEIEFILKYIFYYAVYVLGRNVITKKEDISNIYTVIIFTSIIPIILGLDIRSGNNTFQGIIKYFNIGYKDNFKPGFTFGYANTMAIYMSVCIFLSLYKIYNTKDKLEKFIYIFYSLIALYIIYISYARMVVLLVCIFLLIFFIKKYKNNIIKNKNKIFTVTTILLIAILSIFTFTLSTSSPIYTEDDLYDKVLNYNFKKNTNYKITIDMDLLYDSTINEQLNNSAFNVKIVSVNKYYKEELIYNKFFGNGHHKQDIELKTYDNTEYLKLYVSNNYKGAMQINKLYINDEEYIIHYKYLPVMVGKFIGQLKVKDKSLVERFYYYKDSIKIFKNHMIIGNGGNAWRSLSKVDQDYAFSVKETHSYFFELLISYGLIGVITYFVMLVNILLVLIKNKKQEEKNILIYVLGILLLHSLFFDFNMSFMFIQIITYTLFACILNDTKKDKTINKKYDYSVFILLGLSIITCGYMCLYEYSIIDYYIPLNKNIIDKKLINISKEKISDKKKLNILKDIMNEEPYYNQNYTYNTYFNILNNSKLTDKEFDSYYEFIIDKLKTTKPFANYYVNLLYVREKVIHDSIKSLENTNYKHKDKYLKELKNILGKEHNKYIKNIKDSDRNDLEKYVSESIGKKYDELYEEVK